MSDWEDRNQKKEKREVVIQDRRHTRDMESEPDEPVADVPEPEPVSAAEPEPGPSPEPEPAPPAPEPPAAGEVVEFRQPEREPEPPAAPPEPGDAQEVPPPQSAEEAQLRMLFEVGLNGYLHGQIQLLLTFALIYLGRQPNPATGLIAVDLEKARTAIDLLDFITNRTRGDLPPEEQANLTQLVTELKMVFAQAAQATPPPAPEVGE